MRALVTGAGGFVGRYALAELAAHGHSVCGIDLGPPPPGLPAGSFRAADILDGDALAAAVRDFAPDACLHLAAVAFVPAGAAAPHRMVDVNVMGTTRLLDAFRTAQPRARLLCVSTAQVYGTARRASPVREDAPLAPASLYAITKAAADEIARFYARQYGLHVMVARPYNHIGPGQDPHFVIASFAQQVQAIRRGAPPRLAVGNLESLRDFADVRDVCRAYRLLLENGAAGDAYNIASGRLVNVGHLLDRLCALAGIHPEIRRDPARYRADDSCLELDTSRLRAVTGWTPEIPLDRTLADILERA